MKGTETARAFLSDVNRRLEPDFSHRAAAVKHKSSRHPSPRRSKTQHPPTHRSFIVLSSLVGVLTLTSVLLRAMQGAPPTPDAASALVASDSRTALRVIFNTQVPPRPNRWQSVYVHHSRTPRGGVATLAGRDGASGDHFVVGQGGGGGG